MEPRLRLLFSKLTARAAIALIVLLIYAANPALALPVPLTAVEYRRTIAATGDHSIVLKDNGTVWASGSNSKGQLGVDPAQTPFTTAPIQVPGLSQIVAVAVGNGFSLALHQNGTVYSWGANDVGQLGRTPGNAPWIPTTTGLTGMTNITAAGAGLCFAIRASDGAVFAWGDNRGFGLGLNTAGIYYSPTLVPGLAGIVKIDSSGASLVGVALTASGQVYRWASSSGAVLVTGLVDAIDVAASNPAKQVAVLYDGRAVTFEAAFQWPVTGTSTSSNLRRVEMLKEPNGLVDTYFLDNKGALYGARAATSNTVAGGLKAIPNAPLAIEISAQGGQLSSTTVDDVGGSTLLLRDSSGRVFGKGRNRKGTLGDGTMTLRTSPAQVQLPTGVIKVVSDENFSAAVLTNGEVWIWGDMDGFVPSTPTKLAGLPEGVKATDIATGSIHLLVRGDNSQVYSWGYNTFGQLGMGDTDARWTLTAIPGITTATKVAAAFSSSFCLLSNGQVRSWGYNSGNLGSGNSTNRQSPGNLLEGAGSPLQNVTDIVARDGVVYLLRTDKKVRTCGAPTLYAGLNSTVKYPTTPVTDVTNVEALAVGTTHTIARLTNGNLVGWGTSPWGALGTVSTTNLEPFVISGVNAVSNADIGCGFHNTFTLTGGSLRGWGWNGDGQVGDGTIGYVAPVPTSAGPIAGLKAVTGMTGGSATFGIKASDSTLWAWGWLHEAMSGVWRPEYSQMAIRLRTDFVDSDKDGLDDDSDQDGLNDKWENEHFCGLITQNGGGDPDGDGVTNVQENVLGTNPNMADSDGDGVPDGADGMPTNFYNRTVQFTKVGGDLQTKEPNTFVDNAIQVKVAEVSGTPIANAPVIFRVTSANGGVAPTTAIPAQKQVTVTTDAAGLAAIRFKTGVADLEIVELTATLDTTQDSVSFKALTSAIPATDQLIRLRASDAEVDDNNKVSEWRQALGVGAYATQANANLRALKTTAVVGTVLQFDGVDDYFATALYSPDSYSAGFTAFFVMHPQTPSNTLGMVLSGDTANSSQTFFKIGIERAGAPAYPYRFSYQSGSTTPYVTDPDTVRVDNYALYTIVHKLTPTKELILYRNGVEVSKIPNANQPPAPSNPYIGKDSVADNQWFKGGIAEIVTYKKALSDTERTLTQNILMGHYGLSAPPVIEIAPLSNVRLPNLATLTATITDESPVTVLWQLVASDSCGEANVQINSPSTPQTTVQFDRAGVYTFRITATEGLNASQKDITVTVDAPPVVDAGSDLLFSAGETGELRGSVTDDGRPAAPGLTTEVWTKLSGPGTATLTPANAASTTVKFSTIGSYVMQLQGNDGGGAAVSDTVNVTVNGAAVNPPNYIRAFALNNRVRLTWAPRAYQTTDTPPTSIPVKYTVRRSNSASGPFTVLPGAEMLSVPTFQDTSAVNGSTYYYVVSATKDPEFNPVTSANSSPVSASPGIATCGPVDIAIIFDNTGSMSEAINNVKQAILSIMSTVEETSKDGPGTLADYRLALVSPDNDSVNVRLNFQSNNRMQFELALNSLNTLDGGGTPESTDECLNTVVNELPAAGRPDQNVDFLPFRSNVRNIVIMITDAVPGGFNSTYTAGKQTAGSDEYNAHIHAMAASRKCVQIHALAVGDGNGEGQGADFTRIMTDYALTTGGFHYQIGSDGTGAAAALADMIESCLSNCCGN